MKLSFLLPVFLILLIVTASAADDYEGYIAPSLSGTVPYSVTFTDISYGTSPFTYLWNATNVTGNNIEYTFSTELNPTYIFTVAGNYSVHLIATNDYGTNTSPSSWVNVTAISTNVTEIPVVNFTVNKYTVVFPWIIVINSTSTNTPTAYNYSFGDGTANMTTANGTHQYSKRGIFPLNLYASNSAGGGAAKANIRVLGFQGIAPTSEVCFTASRELDRLEFARVNCRLCGVCE